MADPRASARILQGRDSALAREMVRRHAQAAPAPCGALFTRKILAEVSGHSQGHLRARLPCERYRDHTEVLDDDAGSQTGVTGLADRDGRPYRLPTPLGPAQIVQRSDRRESEDEASDAACWNRQANPWETLVGNEGYRRPLLGELVRFPRVRKYAPSRNIFPTRSSVPWSLRASEGERSLRV